MAPRVRKKLTPIVPTEAVKLGRSNDIVGFENSFTAKDQHDHLEMAIKNWPQEAEPEAEAEPDLVPIEPVASVSANAAPAIDREQGETWWTWAKANAAKKTIILKSIVALLAAIRTWLGASAALGCDHQHRGRYQCARNHSPHTDRRRSGCRDH